MSLIVCGGTDHFTRSVAMCPVCNERHRMVSSHSSIWYDAITTCCGCGDSWSDGFIMSRPFVRGWREAARSRARWNWNRAVDRNAHKKWVRDEIAAYRGRSTSTAESDLLNASP